MNDLVLVVDDDPVQRRLVEAHIGRMGLDVLQCDGGSQALAALCGPNARRIVAVVLDLLMPDRSGYEVLSEMRRRAISAPVVVQTAKGSIDTAIEAMRAGAFDFVVKPASPEKLQQAVGNAVRVARSAAASRRDHGRRPLPELALEGASESMQPVLRQAAKAAASFIPVLIEGETGVGKEWLAQAIRASGERASRPFVAVNCGALPANLAESILFGHEKGAFTDAGARHDGKIREANGGTLFLDEVGELTPEVQVKLLRVLAEGEIDPLGGRGTVRADVRVISATNRDLLREVATGRFRQDLYYRLSAFPIRMPPLRERRSEIVRLAARFAEQFADDEGRRKPVRLGSDTVQLLVAYDWPGNIRELENAVHRAIVLGDDDELGACDFPHIAALHGRAVSPIEPIDLGSGEGELTPSFGTGTLASGALPTKPGTGDHDGFSLFDEKGEVRSLQSMEADLIRSAIKHYNGRMSEIARRLGIGRSTLYRKLRDYKISAT